MVTEHSTTLGGMLLFAMLEQTVQIPEQAHGSGQAQAGEQAGTQARTQDNFVVQPMLGFVAEQVERITPVSLIRPIPLAPNILLGLAVCLGRVVTVVDVTGLVAPRASTPAALAPSHFVVVAEQQASAQQVVFALGPSAGICLAAKPVAANWQPTLGIAQILHSEHHLIWLLDIPLLLKLVWQTCAASSRKFATQRSLP